MFTPGSLTITSTCYTSQSPCQPWLFSPPPLLQTSPAHGFPSLQLLIAFITLLLWPRSLFRPLFSPLLSFARSLCLHLLIFLCLSQLMVKSVWPCSVCILLCLLWTLPNASGHSLPNSYNKNLPPNRMLELPCCQFIQIPSSAVTTAEGSLAWSEYKI